MTRRPGLAAGLTLAVLVGLGACGSAPASHSQVALPTRAAVPDAHTAGFVSARGIGRLGVVLVADDGRTLYSNSKEPSATACPAECRRTWPLLLVGGALPQARDGVDAALLGTVTVGGLPALSYAGRPLHEYVGDPAVGDAYGQDAGSTWFAVTVSGALATGSP